MHTYPDPVKPLLWIAWGLVLLILGPTHPAQHLDPFPNPLGWALILWGLRAVPLGHRRDIAMWLAWLALVCAAFTWVPPVLDAIERTDDSLVWAVDLPQILFAVWLCTALADLAAQAADRRAARWLSVTRTITVVVGVLPVLVFGGGIDSLSDISGGASIIAPLLLCVLMFRYASRPWSGAVPRAAAEVPGSPGTS